MREPSTLEADFLLLVALTMTPFKVNTLQRDVQYRFKVAASNKFGRGQTSEATETLRFGVHTPWPPEPPEA